MDADKEGFLRNARSLIQTVGRAARNVNGHAIFYADTITDSMKKAIDETDRRRTKQLAYNKKHKIVPKNAASKIRAMLDQPDKPDPVAELLEEIPEENLTKAVKELEKKIKAAVKDLEFEKAAKYRDQITALRRRTIGIG
jgi:excinuclease ABC subunit B